VLISTFVAAAGAEIVYTLLAGGLLLLAMGLARPASRWTLVTGIAVLVAGAAGLAVLPLHAAGILMLVLAAASLATEVLMFPGVGIHAAGAGVGLLLAGLFLTGEPPSAHPAVVAPVAVAVAVISFCAGRRSWRRVRDEPFDVAGGLIGRGAVVLTGKGAAGYGVVCGQLWRLRTAHGRLSGGQEVRVTDAVGDCLMVEPTTGGLNSM
jgi:membrane-bound ClpP family serine protease